MKRTILLIIVIGLSYIFCTFLYGYFFKASPFNKGMTIGYPTIYYSFNVSKTEVQHGIIRENIYYNLLIILIIYVFVQLFIKYIKRSGNFPNPPR
jgi:hypothetical protein